MGAQSRSANSQALISSSPTPVGARGRRRTNASEERPVENPRGGGERKGSGAPEAGHAWPGTPVTSTTLALHLEPPPALTQGIQ